MLSSTLWWRCWCDLAHGQHVAHVRVLLRVGHGAAALAPQLAQQRVERQRRRACTTAQRAGRVQQAQRAAAADARAAVDEQRVAVARRARLGELAIHLIEQLHRDAAAGGHAKVGPARVVQQRHGARRGAEAQLERVAIEARAQLAQRAAADDEVGRAARLARGRPVALVVGKREQRHDDAAALVPHHLPKGDARLDERRLRQDVALRKLRKRDGVGVDVVLVALKFARLEAHAARRRQHIAVAVFRLVVEKAARVVRLDGRPLGYVLKVHKSMFCCCFAFFFNSCCKRRRNAAQLCLQTAAERRALCDLRRTARRALGDWQRGHPLSLEVWLNPLDR